MNSTYMPTQCPGCGSTLHVSEVTCAHCHAVVRGEFSVGPLGALPAEQRDFMITFVLCRGNIREVEQRLGISYPTVRRRLENLIAELQSACAPTVHEILTAVESHRLSPREAARLLADARGESNPNATPESTNE
jgi:hypothetical protein